MGSSVMDVEALLEALEVRDVHLCILDGDLMHVDAPEGVLTPELRQTLVAQGTDLAHALTAPYPPPQALHDTPSSSSARAAADRLAGIDDVEQRVRLRGEFEQTAEALVADGVPIDDAEWIALQLMLRAGADTGTDDQGRGGDG